MISNNSISWKTKLIKDKAESCHINCNHDIIFYEKIAEVGRLNEITIMSFALKTKLVNVGKIARRAR